MTLEFEHENQEANAPPARAVSTNVQKTSCCHDSARTDYCRNRFRTACSKPTLCLSMRVRRLTRRVQNSTDHYTNDELMPVNIFRNEDVSRDQKQKRDIQHTLDVPDKRSVELPTQLRPPLPSLWRQAWQDSLNTIDLAAFWRSPQERYRKSTDREAAISVSSYSVTTALNTNGGD